MATKQNSTCHINNSDPDKFWEAYQDTTEICIPILCVHI